MKTHYSLYIILALFALNSMAVSPTMLKRVVPKGIDLEKHPDAKRELIFHLNQCGEGVVKSRAKVGIKNRCTYNIELDEMFFAPLRQKTGFIYDPEWAHKEGVEWITASNVAIAQVPDKWDLSDISDMIRITKQRCGDCWAQATRANLEQMILTWTLVKEPLSTQTLISSCCGHGTCGGGYMTTPDWVIKYGLPVISRDPYKGTNSSCKFDLQNDKMDYKLVKSPYVGSSLNYSRAIPENQRTSAKVEDIMANMMAFDSNAVVTISAISQSGGIIRNCSNINSRGNHMQNIVGWYKSEGQTIARVQNSWGTGHGQNGYTHIRWECGDGNLNRGLARSARIGIYTIPTSCEVPDPYTGPTREFTGRAGVRLGRPARTAQTCKWLPTNGLDDPTSCNPVAKPKMATEYHLVATTGCASGSAMVVVKPTSPMNPGKIRTPHGIVSWNGN